MRLMECLRGLAFQVKLVSHGQKHNCQMVEGCWAHPTVLLAPVYPRVCRKESGTGCQVHTPLDLEAGCEESVHRALVLPSVANRLAQVLKCQGMNIGLAASWLLNSSSAHGNMDEEMRHILWSPWAW